jgi:hypothetical protein
VTRPKRRCVEKRWNMKIVHSFEIPTTQGERLKRVMVLSKKEVIIFVAI